MNYMKEFMYLRKTEQLHYEPACQKDNKKVGKEIYGVMITEQDLTQ